MRDWSSKREIPGLPGSGRRDRPKSFIGMAYACGWSDVIIDSSVVLPEPFAPRTTQRWPRRTVQCSPPCFFPLMSCSQLPRTTLSPYCTRTPSISISGSPPWAVAGTVLPAFGLTRFKSQSSCLSRNPFSMSSAACTYIFLSSGRRPVWFLVGRSLHTSKALSTSDLDPCKRTLLLFPRMTICVIQSGTVSCGRRARINRGELLAASLWRNPEMPRTVAGSRPTRHQLAKPRQRKA